jgi:ubiquitin carboxyl-terminal hydrolase L3
VDLHEHNALTDTTPLSEDSEWNHFVTFSLLGGNLWELDGRKPQPINHGPCDDVLKGALDIVKRDFHPNVPDIMETSMVAFCGISEW